MDFIDIEYFEEDETKLDIIKEESTNIDNEKVVHEKIKYSCELCGYQAKHQVSLKTHIQSIHEKIKYPCNMCNYQATQQGRLKCHIQSVHEKIKYQCKICDHHHYKTSCRS